MNRYMVHGEPKAHKAGDYVLWEDYEKLEAMLDQAIDLLSMDDRARLLADEVIE